MSDFNQQHWHNYTILLQPKLTILLQPKLSETICFVIRKSECTMHKSNEQKQERTK